MKLKYQDEIITYDDLVNRFDLQENGIQTDSDSVFRRTVTDVIDLTRSAIKHLLPKKPVEPQQPSDYEYEYIPFEGPSSIWIDDDRSESEKYRYVKKSSDVIAQERIAYEESMRQYEQDYKLWQNKMDEAKSTTQYKDLEDKLDRITGLCTVYDQSQKIPEWQEVYTAFSKALNEAELNGSSRGGVERLRNIALHIDQSNQGPMNKIHSLVENMLSEYRHILRGGLAGWWGSETESKLAISLQKFSREVMGIELPKTLGKGEELSVDSLRNTGKLDIDLYETITGQSMLDKRFNVQRLSSSDESSL